MRNRWPASTSLLPGVICHAQYMKQDVSNTKLGVWMITFMKKIGLNSQSNQIEDRQRTQNIGFSIGLHTRWQPDAVAAASTPVGAQARPLLPPRPAALLVAHSARPGRARPLPFRCVSSPPGRPAPHHLWLSPLCRASFPARTMSPAATSPPSTAPGAASPPNLEV